MNTSDFDYLLPEELIAQTPLKDRASSRLLVLDKITGKYQDKHFTDILDYLDSGDALVLNETKVLPARIYGTKPETGGAVELLLLKDLGNDTWECLARPQKRLKPGTIIHFGNHQDQESPFLTATVTELQEEGITHIKFTYKGIFLEILEKLGTMPLPPYIHEQLKDQSRYQTVYAKNLGSAAAPTAGLHFTPELLKAAAAKGIKIIKITLHVGLGTFRPVQTDNLKDHKMHTETYVIDQAAAAELNAVKKSGKKIVAVGTTTVRTLESNLQNHPQFTAETKDTDIFIYPGYQFKAVDALITNFHLPKSTLLMLVSAFCATTDTTTSNNTAADTTTSNNAAAGIAKIKTAYAHAVQAKYRFFSFGDAMLITELP